MSTQPSLFPPDPPRSVEELTASALAVIDSALATGARFPLPMFSGGHDSLCAVHLCSQHPSFTGRVEHINTGIGSKRTRQFVGEVCGELGWELVERRSPSTYEQFVRFNGFPWAGAHSFVYARLKERCVREMTRGPARVALVTGVRRQESVRRMGRVEPVAIGETSRKTGKVSNRKRVWTAPCHDWSTEEQQVYMAEHDLPKNPVKVAIGMSGECFCGAFAAPGEIHRIRHHCPDVAEEIDRLAEIAKANGKPCVWGTRPPTEKGLVAVESGPLCSTCDRRAYAAGLLFDDVDDATHERADEEKTVPAR